MTTQEQHLQFAMDCFNEVWVLLEKERRTPGEDRLMREMAHASLFHWLRRDDCTAKNISIGLWQISRVYAVLGQGDQALGYAEECIAISEEGGVPAFYQAYAYEAAARGALLKKDPGRVHEALKMATELAGAVEDDQDKQMLCADLSDLRSRGRI